LTNNRQRFILPLINALHIDRLVCGIRVNRLVVLTLPPNKNISGGNIHIRWRRSVFSVFNFFAFQNFLFLVQEIHGIGIDFVIGTNGPVRSHIVERIAPSLEGIAFARGGRGRSCALTVSHTLRMQFFAVPVHKFYSRIGVCRTSTGIVIGAGPGLVLCFNINGICAHLA